MTEKKYEVVVTRGGFGVYWTEVICEYDNYEQASLRAYEVNGSVKEVEEEGYNMTEWTYEVKR